MTINSLLSSESTVSSQKIDWQSMNNKLAELDTLAQSIKLAKEKGEYVERLALLRKHDLLADELKSEIGEAHKIADQNLYLDAQKIEKSLAKVLDCLSSSIHSLLSEK